MKKIRRIYGYQGISRDISSYGYVYDMKKYIISILFVIVLAASGSWLFQLKVFCVILLGIVGLLCLPSIIKAHYYMLYQQKRFRDVDGYLHQMIYSFQKSPKINIALKDSYKISDGKMQKLVGKAIDELNYSMSQSLYTDALSIIEEEYACERMTTLHRFMINVEEKGGSYHNSLSVLLGDCDRWVKSVYRSQEDIKKVKRDISIGIVISILLAATSVIVTWILKSTASMDIRISEHALYQLISTVFLAASIIFYTYTQVHYKCDWLTNTRSEKQVEYDLKTIRRKKHKGMIYRAAWKRIREDLYCGFSEWLRNVALGLQDKTFQAAIKESYKTCPCVMRASLEGFIDAIEVNPSDVTPYYSFLGEFQVPDISASVRTLYGLSELDHCNMDSTINTMIARNYELQDKHECLKQADRLSLMKFSEYVPVFMVSIKIGLDMMLLLICYL